MNLLLAKGEAIIAPDALADTARVAKQTAQTFLAGLQVVGLVDRLEAAIPVAGSGRYIFTERYPGAPAHGTLLKSALARIAAGQGTPVAFGYHSALGLHGLTEVTPTSLHLIKVYESIQPPAKSVPGDFVPSVRAPTEWTILRDRTIVYRTLRSGSQIQPSDIMTTTQEGFPLPVTAPLRTLVDAWMHPNWCGGADRVADSWHMYWDGLGETDRGARSADLTALLIDTAWPGLWQPLCRWAESLIPDLRGLGAKVDKLAARRS